MSPISLSFDHRDFLMKLATIIPIGIYIYFKCVQNIIALSIIKTQKLWLKHGRHNNLHFGEVSVKCQELIVILIVHIRRLACHYTYKIYFIRIEISRQTDQQ